jgi:hypothetical protein
MSLRLCGEDGTLTPWVPADSGKVLLTVKAAKSGPATAARARAVAAAAGGALSFLGYEPHPKGSALALQVASVTPEEASAEALSSRGFSAEDFHYMCLKTHFRKPLPFSWDALAAARSDLGALRSSAASLAGVTLEPSSRGVTGYQHRFREALQRDFDFPEALSCVWDGLRPGALSPGSKAALLRVSLPALGLVTPE